jgi:SAM-dependent methyltransferase
LVVGTIVRCEPDEDILEGVLVCPNPECQREHPIIDGIAVVVPDLQSWASHQLDAVVRRDDLSSFMASLLGDAAGPGSVFDRERTNLSAYARTHWGDLDPVEPLAREASFVSLFDAALQLMAEEPRGVWLDLGCSVGRGTLELARRTGDLAVGVDLSFSMLRVAERMRRAGRATFDVRRVGLVYDRCDLAVADVPTEHLSFWCCDVGALPFADALFDGALSLNVVDCVPSPLGHLMELGRVLAGGAPALLSSPYDWSPNATPVAQWLGGHSQRSPQHGSSPAELRRALASIDHALVIKHERDRAPWRVYVNERASMDYAVHLLHLERSAAAG